MRASAHLPVELLLRPFNHSVFVASRSIELRGRREVMSFAVRRNNSD